MPFDVLLVLGLSAAVITFAWRCGGLPEKLAASLIVLNLSLDILVHTIFGELGFDRFSSVRLTVDTVELALISTLALYANRVWPLVSAAAQLVAVGGSVAVLENDGGMQVAYWALTQLPLFVQITALAIGTASHQRRKAMVGPYRDWRARRTSAR